MIVMLDTSHKLDRCSVELGGLPVEQLLTPLTRYYPQKPAEHFAVDNGAFAGFRESEFTALLLREYPRRHLCRFVTVPDVVGNAQSTMSLFDEWQSRLSAWPLAFVCQDGQEPENIPLEKAHALFIGGSTTWKLSDAATRCVKTGQAARKWVHVGRVNTVKRFIHFLELGADSIDGTGLSRFSWMRHDIGNYYRHGRITYSRHRNVNDCITPLCL